MPIVELERFAAALPSPGVVFGLDLGTKTIGVALSDLGRQIASPLALIRRTKFSADSDALLRLAGERGGVGFVLGLPLNMDGSEGPRAQATRAFARNLSARTDLPITYWDERLSTAAVTRTLIEADRSRARRAELIDKLAAAFILQGALDRMRRFPLPLRNPPDDRVLSAGRSSGEDHAAMIRSESTVTVDASAREVWQALTDPALIKQWLFGASTETDWKVGSPIVHTGEFDGKAYHDKGTILAFEPERRLVHSHWSDMSGRPDRPENYETVTYELRPRGRQTEVAISEENLPSDEAKAWSEEAWKGALASLKALVEGGRSAPA